jgi:bacillithiol biosynthesis cysteine-adding enzyme BshC
VEIRPLPYSALARFLPPLFLDYVQGKAGALFAGDFRSLEAIGERARETFRPIPAEVKPRWEEYLQSFGAPPKVLSGLERLAAGASCVVTGQQPGLFGGPAYNLYKALTAVKLAALVERHTHMPCVPVFWNHSDDHSLAEFSTFVHAGPEGSVEVSLPVDDTPVPAYLLDGRWIYAGLLDRMAGSPGMPPGIVDFLRGCYRSTPAEGFTRVLLSVFGSMGLVPVEPRLLDGELTKKLYARVLARPADVREALERGAARVEAAGYEPVLRGSSGTGVYAIRDGLRRKVESANGSLTIGGEKVTAWDLLGRHRVSPQVFLRPIVQDAVLPTCAYVGGPNEIAYLAELRELYAHLEAIMPVLCPRASVSVVDAGSARAMEKLGIDPAKIFMKRDELVAEVIRGARGNALSRIDELSGRVLRELDALAPALQEMDKNLEAALDKTRANVERILQALQGRVVKSVQEREDVQKGRISKLLAALRPGGDLQERRLGLASLLSTAGKGFPERLLEALDPLEPAHRLAVLPEEL